MMGSQLHTSLACWPLAHKGALPPFAGELVLWEPTHGRRGRGRPSATFIDTLKRDLGTDDKLELEVCMTNQEDWRARRAARLRPP